MIWVHLKGDFIYVSDVLEHAAEQEVYWCSPDSCLPTCSVQIENESPPPRVRYTTTTTTQGVAQIRATDNLTDWTSQCHTTPPGPSLILFSYRPGYFKQPRTHIRLGH